MNGYKNGFWFNLDSIVFAVAVIWFSGCCLATRNWPKYNGQSSGKNMMVVMFSQQLLRLAPLICIIKFQLANRQVNKMLQFNDKQTTEFGSCKYSRRNLIVVTIYFLIYLLCKLVLLADVIKHFAHRSNTSRINCWRKTCLYADTWPIMILNWQFLVGMQVFNRALIISMKELERAVIISMDPISNTNYQTLIIECIFRLKAVLEFRATILRVYGLSIVLSQFRAASWVIMNAYFFSYDEDNSMTIIYGGMMFINILLPFFPHLAGQEIFSRVS